MLSQKLCIAKELSLFLDSNVGRVYCVLTGGDDFKLTGLFHLAHGVDGLTGQQAEVVVIRGRVFQPGQAGVPRKTRCGNLQRELVRESLKIDLHHP